MVSTWRNFKNIFSRPLFTIIFRPEMLKFHLYSILTRQTMARFVIYSVLRMAFIYSVLILGLKKPHWTLYMNDLRGRRRHPHWLRQRWRRHRSDHLRVGHYAQCESCLMLLKPECRSPHQIVPENKDTRILGKLTQISYTNACSIHRNAI